jgi:hypothetical protein
MIKIVTKNNASFNTRTITSLVSVSTHAIETLPMGISENGLLLSGRK